MSNQSKKIKVILAGGGTLGSVTPLIAICEELKKQQPALEFLWLGTKTGPERALVESYGIYFQPILSAKLRRYFSWQNFWDLLILPLAVVQVFLVLLKQTPLKGLRRQTVILSAGGFVSVPVVWAGWLLKIPSIIHQQDIKAGLANKLMAPLAKLITVTFAESAKSFPAKKTAVVGNPVRSDVLQGDKQRALEIFQLEPGLPTLLVLGGGTGAQKINELVWQSAPALLKFCQIIHFTGAGKSAAEFSHPNYHKYDFLTGEIKHAYAAATLVITRAGMSTLSELAALKKPTIIIPIPDSHQLDNAREFGKNKAAVVLEQNELDGSRLVQTARSLLADKARLDGLGRKMGEMMRGGATKVFLEKVFNLM